MQWTRWRGEGTAAAGAGQADTLAAPQGLCHDINCNTYEVANEPNERVAVKHRCTARPAVW
jgi:hypothetical protein